MDMKLEPALVEPQTFMLWIWEKEQEAQSIYPTPHQPNPAITLTDPDTGIAHNFEDINSFMLYLQCRLQPAPEPFA